MATRRDHRKYRDRARHMLARAKASDAACHLCGEPIAWDAEYTDAKAPTADHIEAVGSGGSMFGRLLPAHRGCNASRGKKSIDEYLESKPEKVRPTLVW